MKTLSTLMAGILLIGMGAGLLTAAPGPAVEAAPLAPLTPVAPATGHDAGGIYPAAAAHRPKARHKAGPKRHRGQAPRRPSTRMAKHRKPAKAANGSSRKPAKKPAKKPTKKPTKDTKRSSTPSQTAAVPAAYQAFSGTTKQSQSWWNKAYYAKGYVSDAYLRTDFPQPCDPDPSADAIQFLWVHQAPLLGPATSQLSSYGSLIQQAAAAAASAFTASAHRYLTSDADYYAESLAPRYVTNSNCTVSVIDVTVPSTVWMTDDADDDGPFAGGGLTSWLERNGYDAPNRKYVAFVQGGWPAQNLVTCVLNLLQCGWGAAWDAISGITSIIPNEIGMASYANNANDPDTWSFVSMAGYRPNLPGAPQALAHTVAHEIVHSLGGLMLSAPHNNPSNPDHPDDCGDLLCYGEGYPGENWSVCPSDAARDRLDCGHNDYWAPSGQNADGTWYAAPTWTRSRWSLSSFSTYLYGTGATAP